MDQTLSQHYDASLDERKLYASSPIAHLLVKQLNFPSWKLLNMHLFDLDRLFNEAIMKKIDDAQHPLHLILR